MRTILTSCCAIGSTALGGRADRLPFYGHRLNKRFASPVCNGTVWVEGRRVVMQWDIATARVVFLSIGVLKCT